MTGMLRIPNEPRFVRAFALAVDPGDALSLLLEIGALSSKDLSFVRRTREALEPAHEMATERRDWDLVHATSVLSNALAQPDHAAFLAYQIAHPQLANQGNNLAEALATIGCACEYQYHRRPWEVACEPDAFNLGIWRGYMWRLLFTIPGEALPKPSQTTASGCTCSDPDSPKALANEHASWCPASTDSHERNNEP
jgi:hypothetical protein